MRYWLQIEVCPLTSVLSPFVDNLRRLHEDEKYYQILEQEVSDGTK